ncbi:hypothetical protein H0A36_15800 [Endozoicomonas sp. SM1973]|uniref:Uncharacterized protein n=1 Tax=Spartinivicinus marinus TaxID=2994442 RepID=A0A853IC55_9GAMM|nr:hypothetical protein [Spartinivicinus marinus]MCX4028407.1 hypothetical protein [Spartinivicinus marinus]NYZ67481.1 hypothetical protein [Spartinivicinus marinus]
MDQILIDHFTSVGITDPQDIIVTAGYQTEASGVFVTQNTAYAQSGWIPSVRPTVYQWKRVPLLELAKTRAFGSSAPAKKPALVGAHKSGQPLFPIPPSDPNSLHLEAKDKHQKWPDIDKIKKALKDSTNILIKDHSLIDFSKIRWKQRYGLPKSVPPTAYIQWVTNTGTAAEENQRAKTGNSRIVSDMSDFKIWHVDQPAMKFSNEARKAFLRVMKAESLDASDWAYMILTQVKAETTATLERYYPDQLLYSAQLAYRSSGANPETGELSPEEMQVIEKFHSGNPEIITYIPDLAAQGNAPATPSKHHALITDEAARIYIWHFSSGPKQGMRGGFSTKEAALAWYKNWLINTTTKAEVYPYYAQSYLQMGTEIELNLKNIGRKVDYGKAMTNQFFRVALTDIDTSYKQRSEQHTENLKYWFDFTSNIVGILGVGISGKLSKIVDMAVVAGGIGVGGITIINADSPNEKIEGIGSIIESVTDTLEATGVGNKLARQSSVMKSLFRGGSAKLYQYAAQGLKVNGAASIIFENKASINLQSTLNQIWDTTGETVKSVHNARKYIIEKGSKKLHSIFYQGKAYARFPYGFWFNSKLDASSLQVVSGSSQSSLPAIYSMNELTQIGGENSVIPQEITRAARIGASISGGAEAKFAVSVRSEDQSVKCIENARVVRLTNGSFAVAAPRLQGSQADVLVLLGNYQNGAFDKTSLYVRKKLNSVPEVYELTFDYAKGRGGARTNRFGTMISEEDNVVSNKITEMFNDNPQLITSQVPIEIDNLIGPMETTIVSGSRIQRIGQSGYFTIDYLRGDKGHNSGVLRWVNNPELSEIDKKNVIGGYYIPFTPDRSQGGLVGYVDIPKTNPEYNFAFTPGLNGCSIIVTKHPTDQTKLRVYHDSDPEGKNFKNEGKPYSDEDILLRLDDAIYNTNDKGGRKMNEFFANNANDKRGAGYFNFVYLNYDDQRGWVVTSKTVFQEKEAQGPSTTKINKHIPNDLLYSQVIPTSSPQYTTFEVADSSNDNHSKKFEGWNSEDGRFFYKESGTTKPWVYENKVKSGSNLIPGKFQQAYIDEIRKTNPSFKPPIFTYFDISEL